MKPFIRLATLADVAELAETMCEADRTELLLLNGNTPAEALAECFSSGSTRTVEHEGRVVAMFGVTKRGAYGVPWMLSTDRTRKVTSLAREAREIVKGMAAEHGYLTNIVWSKNKAHLLWVDWLGFEFVDVCKHAGQDFVRFELVAQ